MKICVVICCVLAIFSSQGSCQDEIKFYDLNVKNADLPPSVLKMLKRVPSEAAIEKIIKDSEEEKKATIEKGPPDLINWKDFQAMQENFKQLESMHYKFDYDKTMKDLRAMDENRKKFFTKISYIDEQRESTHKNETLFKMILLIGYVVFACIVLITLSFLALRDLCRKRCRPRIDKNQRSDDLELIIPIRDA